MGRLSGNSIPIKRASIGQLAILINARHCRSMKRHYRSVLRILHWLLTTVERLTILSLLKVMEFTL